MVEPVDSNDFSREKSRLGSKWHLATSAAESVTVRSNIFLAPQVPTQSNALLSETGAIRALRLRHCDVSLSAMSDLGGGEREKGRA